MAVQQSQLVDEDKIACAPVRESTIGQTPIQSLFDFSCSHWVEVYSRSLIHSFDEELQLYELLDLDAEGEDSEEDATGDKNPFL